VTSAGMDVRQAELPNPLAARTKRACESRRAVASGRQVAPCNRFIDRALRALWRLVHAPERHRVGVEDMPLAHLTYTILIINAINATITTTASDKVTTTL